MLSLIQKKSHSASASDDSKASDPGDDQSSTATTDGGEVDTESTADRDDADDSNDRDRPDVNYPDIDASNVPEAEGRRRGKVRGKIRTCEQNDIDATVDELSKRLGWPVETTADAVQELLDDGILMGTSDSGYRVIDD
jgi:hypothetical protein